MSLKPNKTCGKHNWNEPIPCMYCLTESVNKKQKFPEKVFLRYDKNGLRYWTPITEQPYEDSELYIRAEQIEGSAFSPELCAQQILDDEFNPHSPDCTIIDDLSQPHALKNVPSITVSSLPDDMTDINKKLKKLDTEKSAFSPELCAREILDEAIAVINNIGLSADDNAAVRIAISQIKEKYTVTNTDVSAIENIAALRLLTGTVANETILVSGYYAPGDGGGGYFYWDDTSSDTDNSGTIIKPT